MIYFIHPFSHSQRYPSSDFAHSYRFDQKGNRSAATEHSPTRTSENVDENHISIKPVLSNASQPSQTTRPYLLTLEDHIGPKRPVRTGQSARSAAYVPSSLLRPQDHHHQPATPSPYHITSGSRQAGVHTG